ncbi:MULTISPECIES: hypothetical protein [Streptomyces]|uniref:hypothetical protein n=1 Tax=Streptomyces TaxID=1883 RepID=UPI001489B2C0|nr:MULTISPECIES: hypothetical protein [Streptomyces]
MSRVGRNPGLTVNLSEAPDRQLRMSDLAPLLTDAGRALLEEDPAAAARPRRR